MIDEDWNRQVEMAGAAYATGSMNGRKSNGNDLAMLEAQAFGGSVTQGENFYNPIPESAKAKKPNNMVTNNNKPIQILQETNQQTINSKLPKSILDSFASNPSPLDIPDDYNTPPASYYQQVNKQPLMEQSSMLQYSQQSQNSNNAIDYNYIKYLIKEALSEQSINESINMNNFKGMRIAEGNVIQFIDAKGNLYEGVLKLKKRAK